MNIKEIRDLRAMAKDDLIELYLNSLQPKEQPFNVSDDEIKEILSKLGKEHLKGRLRGGYNTSEHLLMSVLKKGLPILLRNKSIIAESEEKENKYNLYKLKEIENVFRLTKNIYKAGGEGKTTGETCYDRNFNKSYEYVNELITQLTQKDK